MSRRHIPYFDFYPSDFMSGVRGLSPAEVGVYTMMLCRIYESDGPVERNDMRLAAYCGMTEKAFTKALERLVGLGKISLESGALSNARAQAEIDKRKTKLASSKLAGKKSAEKRQEKQCETATPVDAAFNHTDTDTDKSSVANATDGDAVDFTKAIFENGVTFLCRHGQPEKQARGIVGRWRKDHSDRDIFDAFSAANRAGVIDPVPWITARLGSPPQPFEIKFDLSKFEASQ